MKVSTVLVLLLLALLSATSTITKASLPVLDMEGNALEVGIPYDILGVQLGPGPISIGKRTGGNKKCPQYVVKNPLTPIFPPPTAVTLYPANVSETVVNIIEDLNIIFHHPTPCVSNVWKVNDDQGTEDTHFITTDGQRGNPGCATINNWFQIIPMKGTTYYTLLFYPHVCDVPRRIVKITEVEQNGQNRVYADIDNNTGAPPIYIQFQKARSSIRKVV